jgi:hypothetical protein
MTKQQVTENSGVVFRWGSVAILLLSFGIWVNTRLSAVEITQAEQKSDMRHVMDSLNRIETKIGSKP